MKIELEPHQSQAEEEFRELVDQEVAPFANDFDDLGGIPNELLGRLKERGYLGAGISQEFGGRGYDAITCGLLYEQMGRGSCSLLSLFAVHGMASFAIGRWGSPALRTKWLPRLASGEVIGAFALSEPNVGSDARSVETSAEQEGGTFRINGTKQWTSFGSRADVFLVFARCGERPTALLVERSTPGLKIEPITGMMGFRAGEMATLTFTDCRVPESNLIGKIGFGFSHVANSCLDNGRYCIGWGGAGLIQACADASLNYASKRIQNGKTLKEHQLIQEMLTNMVTDARAARMLCLHAAYLRQTADPRMILETSIAKYFSSRAAVKAAGDAVQIHGANGFSREYPVQRYYRDAKVLEVIEGSTQIHQIMISQYS